MTTFTESIVEEAALEWLAGLGWQVAYGPDIAPDTPGAERSDYDQVVLERRLRDALAELNPDLPISALDDAFRKLTRPEGPTLEARNRAFHHMLVDGVTVEHRTVDGSIRGAQARVLDFDNPSNNDWLAVNQLTVTENKYNRRLMSSYSSTACPFASSSSRTRRTRTPPSGRLGSSSRPTRPSYRTSSQ